MAYMLVPGLEKEMSLTDRYISEYLAPVALNHAVEEILSEVTCTQGKRIRPQLLLLSGRYGDRYNETRDRLCQLGALLEMIHLASLIHDDIVDDSPLRRGKATVQARFGKDMAVYAGDLILSRVMQVLFSRRFVSAGSLFASTIEKMCCGEIGQYECMYRDETTVTDYRSNTYGKTAAMFELACFLGASESGCSKELTNDFGEIGRSFGMLFQMRDDLLDLMSEEKQRGKPVYMDFKEGILTLPVLYAMENPAYCDRLKGLIAFAKQGRFTKEHQQELSLIIRDSGGMEKALQEFGQCYYKVESLIDRLPVRKEKAIFTAVLNKFLIS